MKKILMLLCIVLIVSVYSFADQLDFTIEGDAKVTFGVDLNDPIATGFINEVSSDLKIEIIAEQDDEKGADAPVYGWIKLKEFKWEVEDGECGVTAPGVEAKIMADPVWVQIDSNPDVKISKASIPVAVAAGVGVVDPTDALEIDHDSSGGLEIGVDTDMVEVVVKVVSEYDWKLDADSDYDWIDDDDDESTPPVWGPTVEDTGKNTDNAYAVSGEASVVAVDGLTLKLMANAAMNYTTEPVANRVPFGFGVGCEYELAITEDLTVIPVIGLDLDIPHIDTIKYEVGGGLRLKWPGTWDDEVDLKIFGDDVDVYSGLSVGVNYVGTTVEGQDPFLNLVISAYEDSGDDGYLPYIGLGASLELANLLNSDDVETLDIVEVSTIGLGLVAYAGMDNISGYAGIKTLLRSADTEGPLDPDVVGSPIVPKIMQQESLELVAGIEITDIVPNTSLMIDYASDELMAVEGDPAIINDADKVVDNGILTIAVKIAY
jgi:hypothetical protein